MIMVEYRSNLMWGGICRQRYYDRSQAEDSMRYAAITDWKVVSEEREDSRKVEADA